MPDLIPVLVTREEADALLRQPITYDRDDGLVQAVHNRLGATLAELDSGAPDARLSVNVQAIAQLQAS